MTISTDAPLVVTIPDELKPIAVKGAMEYLQARHAKKKGGVPPLPLPFKDEEGNTQRLDFNERCAVVCAIHDSDTTDPWIDVRNLRAKEAITYIILMQEAAKLAPADSKHVDKCIQIVAADRAKQKNPIPAEARVIGVMAKHPDWNDKQIAEAAGVNRTSLYDMPMFKATREIQKQQGKGEMIRGRKSKDGAVETGWNNED